MPAKIDITGHKYGRLTVLESAGHLEGRVKLTRAWRCQCECGNIVIAGTNELRNGNTNSCGCGRIIDETGKRYGRLTVIRRATKPNGQGACWLCVCDCGKEIITRGSNLRDGVTQSCGCLQIDNSRLAVMLPEGIAAMNNIIRRTRSNATERGYEYHLTREQLIELMQRNCYYCGASPSNCSRHPELNGEFIYNGVDRVDNTRGYTIDNVVPCCKYCNLAKRERTVEEFLEWIKRLHKNFAEPRS